MIDTHIHVVPPGLPGIKPMPADVEKLYKGPLTAMADRLKMEMDQAKLRFAFGMGRERPEGRSVGDCSHP